MGDRHFRNKTNHLLRYIINSATSFITSNSFFVTEKKELQWQQSLEQKLLAAPVSYDYLHVNLHIREGMLHPITRVPKKPNVIYILICSGSFLSFSWNRTSILSNSKAPLLNLLSCLRWLDIHCFQIGLLFPFYQWFGSRKPQHKIGTLATKKNHRTLISRQILRRMVRSDLTCSTVTPCARAVNPAGPSRSDFSSKISIFQLESQRGLGSEQPNKP